MIATEVEACEKTEKDNDKANRIKQSFFIILHLDLKLYEPLKNYVCNFNKTLAAQTESFNSL